MTITAGAMLEYPFSNWTPEAMISRLEQAAGSSLQKGLLINHLTQSKTRIQGVYDQSIAKLIEIQNQVREKLDSKSISETDELDEETTKVITEMLSMYGEALGPAARFLPFK